MTVSPAARVAEQAQALADTVRNGIWAVGNDDACAAGSQALDGLLSVVATLQQERDAWKATADVLADERAMADLLVAVRQERDEALAAYDSLGERFDLVASERDDLLESVATGRARLVAVRERETRLREETELMRRVMQAAGTWDQFSSDLARFKEGALVVSSPPPGEALTEPEAEMRSPIGGVVSVSSVTSGSVSVSPPPGERAAGEASDKKPSDAGEAEA